MFFMKPRTLVLLIAAAALQQCSYSQSSTKKEASMDSTEKKSNPVYSRNDTSQVVMTDEEWRKLLSPEVYQIARQKGTERAGTSHFDKFFETGTYYCAACGNALFRSDTKFDSGCGWPSFY